MTRLVAQEHPMGCAVACVAARCGTSYAEAFRLFETPEYAWTRGYYCKEVVAALGRFGFQYDFARCSPLMHTKWLDQKDNLVFVAPSPRYPVGHYLLRLAEGWMNPWSNYPNMIPVEARIEKSLPGIPSYLIRPPSNEPALPHDEIRVFSLA